MKYTHHFDEVEAYKNFTLWDEVKFWCSVIILTLVAIVLIGEITGLVDGFFNWLSK